MLRQFRYFPAKVRLPDRTKKRSALLAALLLGSLASGGCCLPQMVEATCSPYEAIKNTSMLKFRAARQARRVWKECHEQRYVNHACANDVKKGFVNAYVEAAMGMRGCPPPVPNRGTLSVDCVMHRYPAAIPWYEGYNIGFASAVAQGVDKWRYAPANPDLRVTQCGCPSDGSLGHDGLMGQEVMHHEGALIPQSEMIHQDAELIPQDAELLPQDPGMIRQTPVEIDSPAMEVQESDVPAELVPEPVANVSEPIAAEANAAKDNAAEDTSPGPAATEPGVETPAPELETPAPKAEAPELEPDEPDAIESASDATALSESDAAPAEGLSMPTPSAELKVVDGPETVPTTDLPVQVPAAGLPVEAPPSPDPVIPELPDQTGIEEMDSVHLLPTAWTLGRQTGD